MKKKVEEYKTNDEGSYILEAQTKDGWWCFDATHRFNSFGRLLNHSHTAPNVRMHKDASKGEVAGGLLSPDDHQTRGGIGVGLWVPPRGPPMAIQEDR